MPINPRTGAASGQAQRVSLTPADSPIFHPTDTTSASTSTVRTTPLPSQRSPPPAVRVDLRRVEGKTISDAATTFQEHGATLDRPATDDATWVLGDAIALDQLFLNLLLNAALALQPGGHASLSTDVDGADLRIAVADAGCGIAPDERDRVLDPFFSTKLDGTGLGLSIARQIATMHGGSLKIESEPGHGTRVEVRLPAATAPARPASPAASP
ncbi:MAG: sensor histidine kinase [Gemmatimonadales bacterium]